MSTLFLEPFGGLAGDMLLAALLDLGDPRFALGDLQALAAALVGDEAVLGAEEAVRGGLRGTLLRVETPESAAAPHRRLADLVALLGRPDLAGFSERARRRAVGVLERLAQAEGEVHGRPPAEVHFHEVGAVDTLIDVAGAAFALERLEVERVHATPPLVGSGTVTCAHGELPVPAPGTAALLRGLPSRPGGGGERLTPTGAALLAGLVDSFEPPAPWTVERIGYGAGRRDPREGPANLVRAQLGAAGSGAGRRTAWLLEVNLDDATGEELGFLLEELRAAGALEAWSTAVQMKKSRPGAIVSALARGGRREALERVVFEHSPTLGLRWTAVERTECERETLRVEVLGHAVSVQVRRRPGQGEAGELDLFPEYDDLARAARAAGRPLRAVERLAIEAARRARP
ncbi:MAG: nickel pincer cofactor biosynthesis protein LarC [Planctomycetota bacterium]